MQKSSYSHTVSLLKPRLHLLEKYIYTTYVLCAYVTHALCKFVVADQTQCLSWRILLQLQIVLCIVNLFFLPFWPTQPKTTPKRQCQTRFRATENYKSYILNLV